MTREEFEALRNRIKTSGCTLKSFLKAEGVSYTTYNYWRKKLDAEKREHPIAPITIRERPRDTSENMLSGPGLPGVTLAFPNGLKAHFGRGSERVLMEVLNRSLDSGHVLA